MTPAPSGPARRPRFACVEAPALATCLGKHAMPFRSRPRRPRERAPDGSAGSLLSGHGPRVLRASARGHPCPSNIRPRERPGRAAFTSAIPVSRDIRLPRPGAHASTGASARAATRLALGASRRVPRPGAHHLSSRTSLGPPGAAAPRPAPVTCPSGHPASSSRTLLTCPPGHPPRAAAPPGAHHLSSRTSAPSSSPRRRSARRSPPVLPDIRPASSRAAALAPRIGPGAHHLSSRTPPSPPPRGRGLRGCARSALCRRAARAARRLVPARRLPFRTPRPAPATGGRGLPARRAATLRA
ncbi:hypothetical protein SAMN02745121_01577 [Nannocystis exedens]|uniref:Uncharacterized protein n=1 Tax=Nannocystis exedens TaxID=54 RepID=A0A1I1V6B3_9BACT|nr:hypothetical protein NAEX_05454 [Nannocystis exedens]SFD78454.1 hypothetical protein SAMN02745121_01577 [Nannocystis exedens]